MRSALKLISGGNGKSTPPPGKKKFKEHPLAQYVWRAIYPRPAKNYDEIVERASKAYGSKLTFQQINMTMYHIRHHAYDYGWTIAHAQKGSAGEMRRYFPVLVDDQDHEYRVSDFDEYITAGAISSAQTIATMSEHEGVALEIVATSDKLDRADKRKLRAASVMFTAAGEMAKDVLKKVAV